MAHGVRKTLALALVAACTLAAGFVVAKDIPDNWDGLVRVKGKRMDAVYLAPGTTSASTPRSCWTDAGRVPQELAARRQQRRSGVSRDVSDEDAQKILEKAKTGFTEVFTKEFKKAGIEVASAPGPDVLRLTPGVVDLYINAPDTMSPGRSRTYTMEAGEATLILEARDSVTNTLLGRVLDRRETQGGGTMQMTSSVTNIADFEQLFAQWAKIAIKGAKELKEQSPVPENLQPGQKLN
jgi:hypothetical protein